jgi:putative Holliday junction resolvase
MRILAVDPGSKRIGIALSDPTGTIASPLKVVNHISRPIDAATIAALAQEYEAEKIIVGQSLDSQCSSTISSDPIPDRLTSFIVG